MAVRGGFANSGMTNWTKPGIGTKPELEGTRCRGIALAANTRVHRDNDRGESRATDQGYDVRSVLHAPASVADRAAPPGNSRCWA